MYRTIRSVAHSAIPFGPFNFTTQRRWKKPTVTARTRLEDRARDLKLDTFMTHHHKLNLVLSLQKLMSTKKRGPFVSLQLISRWNRLIGLNIGTGAFLRKYPHLFEVFTHPLRRNLCCRITHKLADLLSEEDTVIKHMELENVKRLKKILMMTVKGSVHIHALRLIRRELGLPQDFRESILQKFANDFRLINLEVVELVDTDESLGIAQIEEWREKEFREKWLSEFKIKYAFPINFPTGLKIEAELREKLKNWQRIPYVKPYEMNEITRVRTNGGIVRFEKRTVGILHELLCLTVEKMVDVERLVHIRKDFGIEVNIVELLLKHPGIFYISTKGSNQGVFLREAYCKGLLVEPNPVYAVRRKMLDLILLGRRHTRGLKVEKEMKRTENELCNENGGNKMQGDFVVSLLEDFSNHADHVSERGD